jgi:hypothetical protein
MSEELRARDVFVRLRAGPDPLDYSRHHHDVHAELDAAIAATRAVPVPETYSAPQVEQAAEALKDAVLALVRWPLLLRGRPRIEWGANAIHQELRELCDAVLRARKVVDVMAVRFRPAGPAPRLAIRGDRVFLDGRAVPLDLNEAGQDNARTYLAALLAAGGEWVSSGSPQAGGVRWERVRQRLPRQLRDLTEAARGKGHRLRKTAWRK